MMRFCNILLGLLLVATPALADTCATGLMPAFTAAQANEICSSNASYVNPNNNYLQWRNAANSADLDIFRVNSFDALEVHYPVGTEVGFFNGTSKVFSVNSSGQLVQDATNGGDLVFNKTSGIIRQGTSDAADSKTLIITGGGGSSGDVARGGYVEAAGNEHTNTGSVVLRPGSSASARVQAYLSNANHFFQVLNDSAIPLFSVSNPGSVALYRTITAGGTTGNQTINKPAGTVNFAAAASTLTVTNSLVDTNSVVIATVLTDDSTALVKNVVCSAGSFVIRLDAAATAETKVGFVVLN